MMQIILVPEGARLEEPMIYLVVWVCLRADPGVCRVWNVPFEMMSTMGCMRWGQMWAAAWDDPTWEIKRWRCSTTPVDEDD